MKSKASFLYDTLDRSTVAFSLCSRGGKVISKNQYSTFYRFPDDSLLRVRGKGPWAVALLSQDRKIVAEKIVGRGEMRSREEHVAEKVMGPVD